MNASTRRRLGLTAIAVGVVWGFSGCGPDGPDVYSAPADAPVTSETVAASGEVVEVRALDNTFIDEVIEIDAGTEVTWANRGRNDHDVVPVADTEDWGVELEDFTPGDTYAHVFATPGTYRYFCTVHGTADVGMVGTVVVH